MNSFETLTPKQRKEVKENLLKQVRAIEKLEASDKSSTSMFNISLFSNKEDKKEKAEKVKVEKVKVEKVKVEKVKEEKKAKAVKSLEDDDKKPRAIKATISSMKEVLDYHHVDYPSNAKKDDLAKLLRENNLVREAEKKESNKKEDK